MPKKKAAPRSPYYFFMMDKKAYYRDFQGILYNMDQLKNLVSEEWKAMDPATRKMYEDRAKDCKGKACRGDRYASDGSKVSDYYKEKEVELQHQQLTVLNIHMHICGSEDNKEVFKERAAKQVHYIMSFNTVGYFQDTYIPIEVGIVEYSVRKGITDSYHKIIDYGTIPPGYYGDAKAHSEASHELFKNVKGDSDYVNIFDDIMMFLKPQGEEELPPIFTTYNGITQTTGCLIWLARMAGFDRHIAKFESSLHIWSSANLLYELRKGIEDPLPSIEIAIDRLKSSAYDYTIGNRCDFHEDKDSRFCALDHAKKICFLISDCVCNLFDVTLTENHLPKRANDKNSYHVFTSPAQTHHVSVTVPRSARATERDFVSRNKFDALDKFDIHSDTNQTIGRGVCLPQHSITPRANMKDLSKKMGLMDLGASGYNPGSGIGRGRPPMK